MKESFTSIGQRVPKLLTPLLLSISTIAPFVLCALIFDSDGGEPYFMSTLIGMFYIPIAIFASLIVAWLSRTDTELRGASLVFSAVSLLIVVVTWLMMR